jgi:hypothetical protein
MSPAKLSAGRDRVKGVDLFLLENDICIYDGVCCARLMFQSEKHHNGSPSNRNTRINPSLLGCTKQNIACTMKVKLFCGEFTVIGSDARVSEMKLSSTTSFNIRILSDRSFLRKSALKKYACNRNFSVVRILEELDCNPLDTSS